MERVGRVVEWNDERGFGFIEALDPDQPRAFFHISDYRRAPPRRAAGRLVRSGPRRQPDGRGRATAVRPAVMVKPEAQRRPQSKPRTLPAWPGWLLLATHLAGLAWALVDGRLPLLAALLLLAVSCVAWIACVRDKHAARNGRWRIPEPTLHLLELAGGWPGAFVAQRMNRHKTRKPSYRVGFWSMALLNLGATWAWLLGRA